LIHLDASFLIRSLVGGSREDRIFRDWLRRGESIAISSISWAEFLCGPVGEAERDLAEELLGEPVPFDAVAAGTTADLFNRGGRRRGSLTDCMIAACAMRVNARLATSNQRDFRRLEDAGLRLATASGRDA
jgi:predicted nucleic acid-binding protein